MLQKLLNYKEKNRKKGIAIMLMFAFSIFIISDLNKLASAFNFSFFGSPVGAKLPEFTHKSQKEWINSKPLSTKDLKNKVVLIDFWTYSCWNCYRSFPWLNALEEKLKDRQFLVIGVHTPEFAHEKNLKSIVSKVREFGLHHPIMVDSDYSYWRAMDNSYWPAFYLIDKSGKVRDVFVGETHKGDKRAKKIERSIDILLAEGKLTLF